LQKKKERRDRMRALKAKRAALEKEKAIRAKEREKNRRDPYLPTRVRSFFSVLSQRPRFCVSIC
jgi:hypothetical protein